MVEYRRERDGAQPEGYAKEEDVKEECATLFHAKVILILISNPFFISSSVSVSKFHLY